MFLKKHYKFFLLSKISVENASIDSKSTFSTTIYSIEDSEIHNHIIFNLVDIINDVCVCVLYIHKYVD